MRSVDGCGWFPWSTETRTWDCARSTPARRSIGVWWETTTVMDVIDSTVPTANANWSLRDAVAAMDAGGTEMLAVVDDSDYFIGVVVEAEIVKLGEILEETGGPQ